MIVDHLADGRTLADTAAMAALTGRPPATIRRHCRHTRHPEGRYDVQLCETALRAAPDPILLSATQAEAHLGIPAGTVRSWASRQAIVPLDWGPTGQPLYDAAQLHRLHRNPREDHR